MKPAWLVSFGQRLRRWRPDWITLLLLAALAYVWFRPPASVSEENRPMPAFALTTLQGATVSPASLRGKVVLLNFWATWCPFCRHEMPAMESFYREHRAAGFDILAISFDDQAATVSGFMRQEGYTFPVALNQGLDQRFGGIDRLPTSLIIDRKGHVRHTVRGQVHRGRLDELVLPLLAEPVPPH